MSVEVTKALVEGITKPLRDGMWESPSKKAEGSDNFHYQLFVRGVDGEQQVGGLEQIGLERE
jgi:hypothetical protein